MDYDEHSLLLLSISESSSHSNDNPKGLSLLFAIICVVDVFGVFPIVALPGAVIRCGWIGIPLVLFIFSFQIYTAIMLGECWLIGEYLDKSIVKKNRFPYAALAEMTCGKFLSQLVTVLLNITIFGGGIPNIIVAAQNLQLIGFQISNSNFDFSYCYWMLILGIILCPFLCLGSPKDMKILCSFSVFVVFLISLMIWICIYNDNYKENIIFPRETLFQNVIATYGILAFQFDIHPMLLTIQVDMRDKSKISHIIVVGFCVTTILFLITSIFAALKYGVNTYPNILEGLPATFTLHFTIFLVTMQLCLTCAISNSALYQNIEDYFRISRDFNYKRCLLRSSLMALAVFVAESVPKFDLVMSLIGGTLTGPLVFIFPPLFYIKLNYMKRQHLQNVCLQTANHFMYHCKTNFLSSNICNDHFLNVDDKQSELNSRWSYIYTKSCKNDNFLIKIILASCVIVFGVFATCTTTYINFINAVEFMSFTPPCLFNLTKS